MEEITQEAPKKAVRFATQFLNHLKNVPLWVWLVLGGVVAAIAFGAIYYIKLQRSQLKEQLQFERARYRLRAQVGEEEEEKEEDGDESEGDEEAEEEPKKQSNELRKSVVDIPTSSTFVPRMFVVSRPSAEVTEHQKKKVEEVVEQEEKKEQESEK